MGRWIQNKDANWRIPYEGSWCLKYVAQAFGVYNQGNPQPDATAAWRNALYKHTDLPPKGITVPVYFSLGNVWQGHIAIRLDDLMVASSSQSGIHSQGYIHPNIQDMINLYGKYNGGCTYLGWSEDLNGIRLVTYMPEITYKDDTAVTAIPFANENIDDPTLDVGLTKIKVSGVDGTHTIVTTSQYSDGVLTAKTVKSDTTIPPINSVTLVGTKPLETPKDKEQDVKLMDADKRLTAIESFLQVLRDAWNALLAYMQGKGKQ